MKKKNIMSFLFLESTEETRQEAEIADNLEQLFEAAAEEESGDLGAKKTPLAKALKTFGIEDTSLELDPEGFCIVTDCGQKHADILRVLGTPDAMHKLAEMGWVVTKPGDVAMTGEQPEFRIRFLEITTVDTGDKDSPDQTYKEIVKKAQEFASTKMDRDDELNPVENKSDEMGDNDEGVGKATDGAQPKGKIKEEYEHMGLQERFPIHVRKAKEFLANGDVFNAASHARAALSIGAQGQIGTPLYMEAQEVLRQTGNTVPESLLNGDITASQYLTEMTSTGSIAPLEQGKPGDGLETKGRGGRKLGRKFKMPSNYKLRQPYATPKRQFSEGRSTRSASREEALAIIQQHKLTPVSWASDVNPSGFLPRAMFFEISDDNPPVVIARAHDPRGPKGPHKGWVEYEFSGQINVGGQMAEGLGASAVVQPPDTTAQEMNAAQFLEAPLPENEVLEPVTESLKEDVNKILDQVADDIFKDGDA